MISKRVADQVGLRPTGKGLVFGVHGAEYVNNYLFQVAFLFASHDPGAETATVTIHVLNKDIEGSELNLGDANFDVLLGMDVLSTCSLSVEGGGGTFSLSF